MNDNLTKPRPRRPRISQFKSVDDFWRYHTDHPEAFSQMDFTGIAVMAEKVRERTQNPLSAKGPVLRGEGAGGGETPHSTPEEPDNKREIQREKTASKDGIGRELNGNSRASAPEHPLRERHPEPVEGAVRGAGIDESSSDQPEQTRTNPDKSEQPVGYKNPPAEHRFKPGNPGGPGGQFGPRSMRKYIRMLLFGDEVDAGFAKDVTTALFFQAIKGNTHAIRIICENGNNRRGTKR